MYSLRISSLSHPLPPTRATLLRNDNQHPSVGGLQPVCLETKSAPPSTSSSSSSFGNGMTARVLGFLGPTEMDKRRGPRHDRNALSSPVVDPVDMADHSPRTVDSTSAEPPLLSIVSTPRLSCGVELPAWEIVATVHQTYPLGLSISRCSLLQCFLYCF